MKKIIIILAAVAAFAAFYNIAFGGTILNSHASDFQTLRVGNVTKNPNTTSADWGTSVRAEPGDVLSFAVYYHNSSPWNAHNLRVRLTPKNSGEALQHIFVAEVWADNFSVVAGSATVYLSDARKIDYINNSTTWRPNQTVYGSQSFIFNQTGNEIFESRGVNLGVILPDWPFQGNVMVGFKVAEQRGSVQPITPVQPTPTVIVVEKKVYVPAEPMAAAVLEKEVQNLTHPNGIPKEVAALKGDLLGFKLKIKNTGTAVLKSVEIKDALSNLFELVNEPNDERENGEIQKTVAWDIKELGVGEEREMFFDAVVVDGADVGAVIKNGGESTTVKADNFSGHSNEVFVRMTDDILKSAVGASAAGIGFSGVKLAIFFGIIAFLVFLFWAIKRLVK